ncbi:MAG: PAC2 family protein [archaeon]
MAYGTAVEIVETRFVKFDKPTVIEGFPSVGLVGSIATEYIATKLEMEEIGFIKSTRLPPVTIVKDGVPKAPIRIYSKDNIIVFVSDTAVPESLTYDLARTIVDWCKKHGAVKIISVGGIAREEKPSEAKIYVVGTDPVEIAKIIETKKYSAIKLGFLTGLLGILMMESGEAGIPAHAYLTDALLDAPDPKAAAKTVDAIVDELGLKLETQSLVQTSDKIEKKISQLMHQTKHHLEESKAYPSVYG